MGDSLAATVRRLADASIGDRSAAVAAVVQAVAGRRGLDVDLRVDGRRVAPDARVAADAAEVISEADAHTHGPVLPGMVLEALEPVDDRRRRGVHHTPPEVAEVIVASAFAAHGAVASVGDPSVGGGAFLLAAAARLVGPRAAVVEQVVGCDIDPLAVATTEAALALWSGGHRPPPNAIRVADFLGPEPFGRVRPDAVVGNPPFLGQLRRSTTRGEDRRAELRARWPGIGGYVDDSAAFLLAATESAARGAVVALVQPTSFLAARDAEGVRRLLDRTAPLVTLWSPGARVFEAAVDVCVPICRVGIDPAAVLLVHGTDGRELGEVARPSSDSWAPLLAHLDGTPALSVAGPPLSSVADITAGFRDQFYGLRGAVVDDPGGRHPLVTSGLIDPLELHWGRRSCRFDGRRWEAPVVEPALVDPGIRAWVDARLRPKVMVASQTRVIEAAADPEGRAVPCTPVVVVEPHDPADVWAIAATLTAPVASAELARSMAGTALSSGALRVSAERIGSLTLPPKGAALARAADLARAVSDGEATVLDAGLAGLEAHLRPAGGWDELAEWWAARLPRRRVGAPKAD